jgi:threonine/homoserine/homoserine lactone efflux protein
MLGIHDLWLFLLAGALLNITPGPDMALIIARSAQGTRSGILAALGVGAGALVHVAAASIGLSALILASAAAFSALKWIGAIYLVYLGLGMLWSSFRGSEEAPAQQATSLGAWQSFLQGMLTNVLNPKVALFFLAFLPQFVDADAPSKPTALLALGLIFDAVGTAWNIAVAAFAGWFAASTQVAPLTAWLKRAIGTLFVGVGLNLAFSDRG